MTPEQEQALRALLNDGTAAREQPQAAPAEPKTAKGTARTGTGKVSARLAESLATGGALLLAGLGWAIGGFFTITALRALGLPLDALGWWAWLIPAAISAIELRWWPTRARGWQIGVFWLVALVDLASTYYGLSLYLAGRLIPLGPGFMLTSGSTALIAVCLAAAALLTFLPERLAKAALRGLAGVWS